MEKTAAAIATLPDDDDVVREILVRVADAAALFRCAITCKRLCALVTDPLFLRRRWPDEAPSLVGFFTRKVDSVAAIFVPMQESPFVSASRLLRSFIPGAPDLILDRVEPLASRGGLVLASIKSQDEGVQLVVCNPIAGTSDMLPPLVCTAGSRLTNYTILTSADKNENEQEQILKRQRLASPETFYRVLLIMCIDATNEYILHTFSSGEQSWTAAQDCFGDVRPIYVGVDHIRPLNAQRSAVVQGGKAHWLFDSTSRYYILTVSVESSHVSATELLIWSNLCGNSIPYLSIIDDGTLSLLRVRWSSNRIVIWTREENEIEDDESEENEIEDEEETRWLCTGMIELEKPKKELSRWTVWPICIGERSSMFFFQRWGMHLANLKTGAIDVVTGHFHDHNWVGCVPFEISWPALFKSRLDGRY